MNASWVFELKLVLEIFNICYIYTYIHAIKFTFRKRSYFVDLFVRKSNKIAINMYKNLGYIIYRTILDYYSGDQDEDAYGGLVLKQMKTIWWLFFYLHSNYRYAQSFVERCRKEIDYTLHTTSTPGRFRYAYILNVLCFSIFCISLEFNTTSFSFYASNTTNLIFFYNIIYCLRTFLKRIYCSNKKKRKKFPF